MVMPMDRGPTPPEEGKDPNLEANTAALLRIAAGILKMVTLVYSGETEEPANIMSSLERMKDSITDEKDARLAGVLFHLASSLLSAEDPRRRTRDLALLKSIGDSLCTWAP